MDLFHATSNAYLCPNHELRITQRCMREDLGCTATTDLEGIGAIVSATFSDVSSHEIVKAFVHRRESKVDDTRQISPLTSGREVWRLGYGHFHRGATWYDPEQQVVWLCAYGYHESGSDDDFFPWVKALERAGDLFPEKIDDDLLDHERRGRFARRVAADAQALLERAREHVDVEQQAIIGERTGAGVVVQVLEHLEETWVAIRVSERDHHTLVPTILAAFYPEDPRWTAVDELPTRSLEGDELAWKHEYE